MNRRDFLKGMTFLTGAILLNPISGLAKPATYNTAFTETYNSGTITITELGQGNYNMFMNIWTPGTNPSDSKEKWTHDGLPRNLNGQFQLVRGFAPAKDINVFKPADEKSIQFKNYSDPYDNQATVDLLITTSESTTNQETSRSVFNVEAGESVPSDQAGYDPSPYEVGSINIKGDVLMNFIPADRNLQRSRQVLSSFLADTAVYGLAIKTSDYNLNLTSSDDYRSRERQDGNRNRNDGWGFGGYKSRILRRVNVSQDGEDDKNKIYREKIYFKPNSRYRLVTQ